MSDENNGPANAGAEPNDVPFAERRLCEARVSDELLISESGHRPDRAQRHDGWTHERVRTFLNVLAECGVVRDAARAAGMSVRSAYYLRNRPDSGAFSLAWSAALLRARQRLGDAVISRALHGCVEVIKRDGIVWAEKHRFDNRLTLAALSRLDRLAEAGDDDSRAARFVAQEFDQFVELVCAGSEGTAAFIVAREVAELPISPNDTARNLARLENYRRRGDGLSGEAARAAPEMAEPPAAAAEAADAEAAEAPPAAETDSAECTDFGPDGFVATWLPPTDGAGKSDE